MMNDRALIKLHQTLRKEAYEKLGERIVDVVSVKLALKQDPNARPRDPT